MERQLTPSPVSTSRRRRNAFGGLALVLLTVSCGRGGAARAGGPPPMPVEAVTMKPRPVEQTTEFVGTVKSRRSTTVQPQVEGFVTKILVRSGDQVAPGAPLMQIDPRVQEAAVANMESQRAARQADLQFAQQDAARTKTLFDAGASSRSELEHAQSTLSAAEAQLKATEAQITEQKVQLAYFMVSAPTAGVVGDIPVRVGDRVQRTTPLTTIDQNAGLEVYINVPVQQAKELRVGLPVHLVDDEGRVLKTTTLSFVSPSVDAGTQSVLVKAVLEEASGLRTDQFVRVQVVWSEAPSLTVPFLAVTRINGQYFGFVAESGEGGQTVAHQRQLDLGAVVGNDYVVRSGLKAGDKLIVSGVQKIRDGAAVAVGPPAGAAGKGR